MSAQAKTHLHALPRGPDAHVVARHFRTGVRLLLALSLIATVVCLFFFYLPLYFSESERDEPAKLRNERKQS